MKFKKLAEQFQELEKTASRNRMTELLARLLGEAESGEVAQICYLALGRLAPLYEGVEFNLAEKLLIRSLAQAYKAREKEVEDRFGSAGDLGNVAENLAGKKKGQGYEVAEIFRCLRRIAREAGEGSVERKVRGMADLLGNLDGLSAKYVVRIPLGKLRLGFSDKTILDALSWMVSGDKSLRAEIEAAYNRQADVGQIAVTIKEKGVKQLDAVKVRLGVPVIPALCQRLPSAAKMIEKMIGEGSGEKVAVEPKYDGTRLQVHFSRKKKWKELDDQLSFDFQPKNFVRIFTRNLENVTHMFPDLVQALETEIKAKEVILDGEAIGFDPKNDRFLPFQETIKRKRKYGVSSKAEEIPLRYFAFDLLFLDGRELLAEPFSRRRELLAAIVKENGKTFRLSPQMLTAQAEELMNYHRQQIDRGLEGVVVKKWQAVYDPGKRGYTWVKFKQAKDKKGGGLADTVDAVVMGYYRGKGKRADFGIGMFLVGVWGEGDQSETSILTISKVGTGLTDEQWRQMKKRCDEAGVDTKPKEYRVDKNLSPDVWCQPQIVVEIEADNITKSPTHTARYALRFPRLVRFRDDKSASQATNLKEIRRLFKMQK